MSGEREKIIRYYSGTEGEETAVRLVDLAEGALRSQKFRLSGFLDPFGAEIAEAVSSTLGGLNVVFSGGYIGAERQRAMFIAEDFPTEPPFEIAAICAEWNGEFSRITHRDVLGSLVGLGIDREKIGDILVSTGLARILTDVKISDFLIQNFNKIGSCSVKISEGKLDDIEPREVRVKEISATVASLRLDSITAAGFGISRSRAAADIEAEKVKLNWQTMKNPSHAVKAGDVLSMRGRGRAELVEIRGTTKKGRIGVFLKRYI